MSGRSFAETENWGDTEVDAGGGARGEKRECRRVDWDARLGGGRGGRDWRGAVELRMLSKSTRRKAAAGKLCRRGSSAGCWVIGLNPNGSASWARRLDFVASGVPDCGREEPARGGEGR
jgi:hypothetical protein